MKAARFITLLSFAAQLMLPVSMTHWNTAVSDPISIAGDGGWDNPVGGSPATQGDGGWDNPVGG